jgi:hypothetical protein
MNIPIDQMGHPLSLRCHLEPIRSRASPAEAVRNPLEASAHASGLDNFGLRMPESQPPVVARQSLHVLFVLLPTDQCSIERMAQPVGVGHSRRKAFQYPVVDPAL